MPAVIKKIAIINPNCIANIIEMPAIMLIIAPIFLVFLNISRNIGIRLMKQKINNVSPTIAISTPPNRDEVLFIAPTNGRS
jgi:hypothetical protein